MTLPMIKRSVISIDRALLDRNLLGAALGKPETWGPWLSLLRAAFALPVSDADIANFKTVERRGLYRRLQRLEDLLDLHVQGGRLVARPRTGAERGVATGVRAATRIHRVAKAFRDRTARLVDEHLRTLDDISPRLIDGPMYYPARLVETALDADIRLIAERARLGFDLGRLVAAGAVPR